MDERVPDASVSAVGGPCPRCNTWVMFGSDHECKNVAALAARLAAVETELDALRAAIREYIDMEPPATASPYWHKPDGGLRAALDSEKNSNSLSQQDSCWSVIDDA